MKLERQTIDLGWKTPLLVTTKGRKLSNGENLPGGSMPTITVDDPQLLQDIQKMKNLRTFRRFCEKYGLLVFGTWALDEFLAERDRKSAKDGVFFWWDQVREDYLLELWEKWKPRIVKLQKDIRNLEKYKKDDPWKYGGLLDKGLKRVEVHSGSPGDLSSITLVLHAGDLRAAVSLQMGLADIAVCEKAGCGIVFARTRADKRYCSPAHRETKSTELRKCKARVRRKLYYKWEKDPARAKVIHENVKRELEQAKNEKQALAVEKKYKLASRQPSKKGKKS